MSFATCLDTGLTLDGSMTYAITSLVASTSAAYKTTFASFTATDGIDLLTMNGDMTNSASLSGTTVTSSISGNSFTIGLNADGFSMNKYSEVYTYNSSSTAYSYAINMSLVLTGYGTVDVTTSPTFSGIGVGNPTVGTMTISGTSGTYVSLSASDATHATMTLNDGTNPVSSTPVLWSSL